MIKICWWFKRLGYLENLLDEKPVYLTSNKDVESYAGWGYKKSGLKAQQVSNKIHKPCLLLEDGFLHSIDKQSKYRNLSLVVDNIGIYYDAYNPSKLEQEIKKTRSSQELKRAGCIIDKWRKLRLSKYNSASEYTGELPDDYVLLIDQVKGDQSIRYGQASESSFLKMLDMALSENPDSMVVVKIHPDVYTKKKTGYFAVDELLKINRVMVIAKNCHPTTLIERSKKVYVVTSQIGFEAMMWGKDVRCFGMPFYAGWGLSNDDMAAPIRRHKVSIAQLVYAVLVVYSRYFDWESQSRCEIEKLMDNIALQKQQSNKFNEIIYAYGFSRWKKPIISKFFKGSKLIFTNNAAHIPTGSTVAIWGNKVSDNIKGKGKLLKVEDGFLRSSGLGASLTRPLSLAIDDQVLYYDSSQPSRLELILQTYDFDACILSRAKKLIDTITKRGVSKYNLAGKPWKRPAKQHVILVPGQVESDLSIQYGAKTIKNNTALLQQVRLDNPHSYIVYKRHPDVVAGLRNNSENRQLVEDLCDEIVDYADISTMISQVDEVHTITSLTGFEALLAGIKVKCYGQPFYAGWGLTDDMHPIYRRTRKLTIEHLVSGALILYPTYMSYVTGMFTTPEHVIDEILSNKNTRDEKRILDFLKNTLLRLSCALTFNR